MGLVGISDDENGDLVFTETLGKIHGINSTVENLNVLFFKRIFK